MKEFDSYSFSRLYLNENIEFFFILGVKDEDNFIDVWDGRIIEVIGYAMIFTNKSESKQENFIYLIEKNGRKFEDVIRYTKQFINQMSFNPIDGDDFEVSRTNVKGDVVDFPYIDFIKSIVRNDIPQEILQSMVEVNIFEK